MINRPLPGEVAQIRVALRMFIGSTALGRPANRIHRTLFASGQGAVGIQLHLLHVLGVRIPRRTGGGARYFQKSVHVPPAPPCSLLVNYAPHLSTVTCISPSV